MTIKECIDLVDASKPNQYSLEEKVGWLSFLDGTIINDVLKTHEGYDGSYDLFDGYSTERLTAELIAPSPYDRLYPAYLKMRIDSENGEIARYNNSAALYNTYLMEYKKWYNRTHMPISGAVMGGAKNDIGGCGCQSNADVAEKAAISAEEARKSAVRASEKAEEASVSAVRAESARASVDNTRLEVYSTYRAVDERAAATREAADEVNAVARGFSEAEEKRVTAESLRVSAEAKRVSAEDERVAEMRKITESLRGKMTYRGEVEVLPENAASGDVYKVKKHVYRDGYCRVMLYSVDVEWIDRNTHRLYFADYTLLFRALRCAYEAFKDTGCALEIISGGKAYTLTWVGIGDNYIDVLALPDVHVYYDIFSYEYGFIKVPLEYAELDDAVLAASILVPEGGMAVYDGEDWIPITAESLVDLMAKVKLLEDDLIELSNSLSDGGNEGFRKIGFTEDCDFVATESDGLTAFRNAVEAAVEGETFVVMPGVYAGTERFDVTKNVNFIGIGKPEISFPVWIQGGGIYNLESYSWDTLYEGVTSKWSNFVFANGFTVGCEYDSNNTGSHGDAVLDDCTIKTEDYINICGKARNCYIECSSFGSGHYYGWVGGTLEGCSIRVKTSMNLFGVTVKSCEIYPATSLTYEYYYNSASGTTFEGCKMYAMGAACTIVNASSGENTYLGDTIVFANSCNSGYLITPVAK